MADALRLPDPGLNTLLSPKWLSGLARLRQEGSGAPAKVLLLVIVGAGFWSAVFTIFLRMLRYMRGAEEIGSFLPGKLLAVVLLCFASILLLSNLITALSTFFLARDLDLLVASPADWMRLYLAKLLETMTHSSWMVILLAIPILTAYGIAYEGGGWFWLAAAGALLPFLVLPATVGSAVTLLLVNVFPARRTRDLLSLIAIGAVAVAMVTIRVLQPERLARPEGFRSLVDFLATLSAPANPFLPTEWTSDMLMNWLNGIADPLPVALLWTTAAAFIVLGAAMHRRLYRNGFTKAQEGAEQSTATRTRMPGLSLLLRGLPPATREVVLKDARVFFRDATQWSQLILLGVLLLVYVFNIRALPLYTGERVSSLLITLVVFLNLGLAGFVLAAIAARFVFPAVSLEGKQMWLLRSSPLDIQTLLRSKYWSGTLPLLLLALLITVVTNRFLLVSGFMMWLTVGTVVLYTFASSALALCFGVLYPRFDTENAAQIPTSFGGLVYMMSAVFLLGIVVSLEARPVLELVRAQQQARPLSFTIGMTLPLIGVTVLCGATTVIALRTAHKRLRQMEF